MPGRRPFPGARRTRRQAGKATEATTTLAKPSQHAVQNKASCRLRSVRTLRRASRKNVFMPRSVGSGCDGCVTARSAQDDS